MLNDRYENKVPLIKQKILYKIKCIALKVFHIIIINFLINVSQFQKYESESAK